MPSSTYETNNSPTHQQSLSLQGSTACALRLNLGHLAIMSSDAPVPAPFTQAYKGDEGLNTQTCHNLET